VTTPTTVRYGGNNTYNFADNISGSIGCNNSTFGDPVGAVVKYCDYLVGNNGVDLSARLSTLSTNWSAGSYQVNDSNAVFLRGANREAPMPLLFGLSVLDGLDNRLIDNRTMNADTMDNCIVAGNCDAAELGQATFYYGRLSLPDTYGPESASLPAKLHAEYWDGQQFIVHILDSDTKIARSDIRFNNRSINVDNYLSIDLSGGISTSEFGAINSTDIQLLSGDAELAFSAPGTGITTKSFTVDIDLFAMPWLRYDWNQDGNDNNETMLPTAIMSFQSYRGHDRILYWRHHFE